MIEGLREPAGLSGSAGRPDFNGRWLTEPADMAPFLSDWRRR